MVYLMVPAITRTMTVILERARCIERWSCGCFQLGLDWRAFLFQVHVQHLKKLDIPVPQAKHYGSSQGRRAKLPSQPSTLRRPWDFNCLRWTEDLRCLPMLRMKAEELLPEGACLSLRRKARALFEGLSTRNLRNLPRQPRCVTPERSMLASALAIAEHMNPRTRATTGRAGSESKPCSLRLDLGRSQLA